jgi:hypothetical protein
MINFLVLLFSLTAFAQVKISDLPPAALGDMDGTDLFVFVDLDEPADIDKTKKLELDTLKIYFDQFYSSGSGDVVGPSSATDNAFALFDGTTGKLLKDSATTIDTDVNLAADSDSRIPTQKAVKAYVDGAVPNVSGSSIAALFARDNFAGDNTETDFVLSDTPTGKVDVYLNGVLMTITDDYTISGSTVSFNSAPVLGQEIAVLYIKD